MNKITNFSVNNQCSRCLQCCTDFISLSITDINRIKKYMQSHKINRNIATTENNEYIILCPFISEKGCQIYPVRPQICRSFYCWHSEHDNLQNKEACHRTAVINGDNTPYKSLHAIFFNDEEYNKKLIQKIIERKD